MTDTRIEYHKARPCFWTPATILFIILIAILARLPYFFLPIEYDEGIMAYLGMQIADGSGFYSTIWEVKGTLIQLLNALAYHMVGNEVWGIKAIAAVFCACSSAMIFVFVKRIWGYVPAIVGALLFIAISSNPSIQAESCYTELFLITFSMGAAFALYLYLENKKTYLLCLAGGFLGCAFLAKQSAITDLGFVCFMFWLYSRQEKTFGEILKSGLYLLIPFLSIILGLLLYFLVIGKLSDYLDWSFIKPWAHTAGAGDFMWYRHLSSTLTSLYGSMPTAFFLFIIGAFSAAIAFVVKNDQKMSFFLVWCCFAFVGASLGGWYYPHYFIQMIPGFTMLALYPVIILVNLAKRYRVEEKKWVKLAFALVLIAILIDPVRISSYYHFLAYKLHFISERQYHTKMDKSGWFPQQDTAAYLNTVLKSDETIFTWSPSPVMYFLTNRLPTTPYVLNMALNEDQYVMESAKGFYTKDIESYRKDLIKKLRKTPPTYVVVNIVWEKVFLEFNSFPRLSAFIQENYDFKINIGGNLIYKRNHLPLERSHDFVSIPVEMLKRYAAMNQAVITHDKIEIQYQPFVNPNGIPKNFTAQYLNRAVSFTGGQFSRITFNFFSKMIAVEYRAPLRGEVKKKIEASILSQINNKFLKINPVHGTSVYHGVSDKDYVNCCAWTPSGVNDDLIVVKDLSKPMGDIETVYVKRANAIYLDKVFGVNNILKPIQEDGVLKVYLVQNAAQNINPYRIIIVFKDGEVYSSYINIENQ